MSSTQLCSWWLLCYDSMHSDCTFKHTYAFTKHLLGHECEQTNIDTRNRYKILKVFCFKVNFELWVCICLLKLDIVFYSEITTPAMYSGFSNYVTMLPIQTYTTVFWLYRVTQCLLQMTVRLLIQ